MIGVIAAESKREVVAEFFELFKVPWTFYRSDAHYGIVLCTEDALPIDNGDIVLAYAGRELASDRNFGIKAAAHRGEVIRHCNGLEVPIWGDSIRFSENNEPVLAEDALVHRRELGSQILIRVGYNLFDEIETLFTNGQHANYAAYPTLELHIALLRKLILSTGIPLVEIPPVPAGYQFTACLTHDVDHPGIRRHRLDHTALGFLLRASLGSLFDTLAGRMSVRHLVRNWLAVLQWPLIQLGLRKDIWAVSLRDYLELEGDVPSTFFFIPFKGRSGKTREGQAPQHRAAQYGAADVADEMAMLNEAGREVGLHGLDAWMDSASAETELSELGRISHKQELGVRMHWLYFDLQSPAALEKAGAAYDSTIGYNETVGYCAGTTQVYKPLQVEKLLELPLHIMDTALFFPCYLHCSEPQAREHIDRVIDKTVEFGGTIVINWHDRSLAPERLWGECYLYAIHQLRARRAWFATASDAVAWFRKRRSVRFEEVRWEAGLLRATVTTDLAESLPGLRLRVHQNGDYQDLLINGSTFACAIDIHLPHFAEPAGQELQVFVPGALTN